MCFLNMLAFGYPCWSSGYTLLGAAQPPHVLAGVKVWSCRFGDRCKWFRFQVYGEFILNPVALHQLELPQNFPKPFSLPHL